MLDLYGCLQSVITVVEFSKHNALIAFNLSGGWKRMVQSFSLHFSLTHLRS